MTLRWIDLPYEVCQQILLYALDLETSPLAQPYQQHDHVFRGRMTLRIHPGTSKYFDCPTASPSPLRRMVHITHRFNKDLDAALPSMERQLEGILGELRLGTEAALKAWFRNYREDYEIVEERSQHGEVGWILQTMAGQVKHNITAIQQLHLSVRMLQVRL